MSQHWEARYQGSDGHLFGTEPAGILADNPGWLRPGLTALCVADGEGRNSVHLAERGLIVTAFDPAPTAVGRAQALADMRGAAVEHHQSDWAGWDWAQTYDLTVAIFIQFATPADRAVQFADLRRATKPGGTLMLQGYTPAQVVHGTGGPRDPSHMYTNDLLQGAFAGWHIWRLAEYERDVSEGRGHSGRSALIDLIASRPVHV